MIIIMIKIKTKQNTCNNNNNFHLIFNYYFSSSFHLNIKFNYLIIIFYTHLVNEFACTSYIIMFFLFLILIPGDATSQTSIDSYHKYIHTPKKKLTDKLRVGGKN